MTHDELLRPIKNKTEHMQYMDGYNNGYKNALSDVDNTLDYINHQLAFIKEWKEKHSTIQTIEKELDNE